MSLFSHLFRPQPDVEVINAYLHKLPDRVAVSWKREEGFIIGEISFSGLDPIYAQAVSPKEFVRMVNDAIYISLDFKPAYIELFHQKDVYAPTPEQWKELNDGKVTSSSFGLASKLAHEPALA